MAQFNADILLAVKGSEKAQREVQKLEKAINAIGQRANVSLGGQVRLKGEQALLKARVKNQVLLNKELRASREIARLASQRTKGLGQYASPIGPQQDRTAELKRRAKINAIAQATAKIDARKTARLAGQNSLTTGLLKLNKATLTAARSEAEARGEAVVKQRALNNELRKTQQYSKPIGPKQAPGRAAAARKRQQSNRLEGLALGGGFPLLFGGGIGQSLAGLAGAAAGPALGLGQMGGGIAAQAAVAAITQATTALAETAAVAGSVGDAYDFLTEKALFASDETQALANKLAELGEVEKLAELVTQELVSLIGNEGVQNLKALDDEVDTFQKEIGKLGLAIGSFLSQYLTPLIEKFNSVLGTINTASAFAAREKDIAGTDREAAFKKRVAELSTPGARGSKIFGEAEQKILLKEFPAIVEAASKITPTLQDKERFTPPKAGGAGKKPYDPTKRIADLTAEAALITKIAEQDRQINNAQVARQNLTVIELQLNKELERIEAKRLDMIRNSKAPDAEKAAINAVAAAKASAAQTEAAGKAYKFLKQNEESTVKQVEQLELQTQLADALTREEQKQLKLQIALLRVKEANLDKTDEQVKALQDATKKLFEAQNQGPLDAYVKQLNMDLFDTEAQIVKLAQVVETEFAGAMSNAIVGLVDGTQTAEEAFSAMFKNIGKAFIDMATQMIAKALVMKALGILTGGGGGGGGFNSPAASPGGAAGVARYWRPRICQPIC